MSVYIWTWDPKLSHICYCLKLKENRLFSICLCFLMWHNFLYYNLSEFSQLGKFISKQPRISTQSFRYSWIIFCGKRRRITQFLFNHFSSSFLWTLQNENTLRRVGFFFLSYRSGFVLFFNVLLAFLKIKYIIFQLNIKSVPKCYSSCI